MGFRAAAVVMGFVLTGCGAKSGLLGPPGERGDASLDGGQDVRDAAVFDSPAMDVARNDVRQESRCPAEPPWLTRGCPIIGQVCTYRRGKAGPCDDVGTDDLVAWRCEERGWLEIARCVETAGCPDAPPAAHHNCPIELAGQDCFYSTDNGCAESAIALCDGSAWRHVNGCPTRIVDRPCGLVATLPPDQELAVEHPTLSFDRPKMALAGTQMLLAYAVSGGYETDIGIFGHAIQTAVPLQAASHVPLSSEKLGRDAITNPIVAFSRDRFVLGWGAGDGWPIHTDGTPGLFIRSLPLHGPDGADVLVSSEGRAPFALLVRPDGGWIGYRTPAAADPSKHAAAIMALTPSDTPVPSSEQAMADETQGAWYAEPVPRAFVRIAPWTTGMVLAVPAIASGDLWDDSGIQLFFYRDLSPTAEPDHAVRITVGMPRRMSIVALRDESVVLAYSGVDNVDPINPFRLVRVWPDGTEEPLRDPHDHGEQVGSGPQLAPLEEGFAAVWTTVPHESPGPVATWRVQGWLGEALESTTSVERTIPGMGQSAAIEMAASPVDGALHLAWSLSFPELTRVFRQKIVCNTHPIK